MSFGKNIQLFINYISENDFKTFLLEDNVLKCTRENFIITWNKYFKSNLRWTSILRNFGNYGIRCSNEMRTNKTIISLPEHFSLKEKFLRINKIRKIRQIHKCTVPGCVYSTEHNNYFVTHVLRHSNKRYFPCDVPNCGYIAKKSDNLTSHMLRHSGERKYKCNYSGCKFSSIEKGHLKSHIRTHTNERPYPCTISGCNYRASESSTLKKHIRTHTNERSYPCTSGCNYSATQISALSRHMKTHTPTNSVSSEKIDFNKEESDNETLIGSESSYYRLFI